LNYSKHDIYAFGLTLWSAMSTIPIETAFDNTTKQRIAELPYYYGDELRSLVHSMVAIDSKQRPTFEHIQDRCIDIIVEVNLTLCY
jgi:hypothetical protein